MKKLFLILLLLGVVFAETIDTDYEVNFDPFDLNISDVGNYDFLLNGSLYEVKVVGGPRGRVSINEVEELAAPQILIPYRFFEASSEGYLPYIQVVFAIPRNWIDIQKSSYAEIKIFMNTSRGWKNLEVIKQDSDVKKHLIRVEIKEPLGDLAIGIVKGSEFCSDPTDWGDCINGNQTRIVQEIIDGVCIPKVQTSTCPIQLKSSYNVTSAILAILGLLIITPIVTYPLVKDRKLF